VRLAAKLYGAAERFALRGAEACVADEWDRSAMLAVEARFLARAVLEPVGVLQRLRTGRVRRADPVLAAVFAGERHPLGHEEHWLADVRRDHRVDSPA
jgi:hypothetical protein